MNFNFFIISILIVCGFTGSALAQQIIQLTPQEFSQEEVDAMKYKAVLITTNEGTIMIELFPDDAPNHVHNFLKLVEDGYYDGMVFHRIIPGFMIQVGDPNTKDPETDRSMWGSGGPGYQISSEFNFLKHERGIVSMARQNHPDTAGSQFFIVHRHSSFLDGQYTAFGKLVPLGGSYKTLDRIAFVETDKNDAPINPYEAMILEAKIVDFSGFSPPNRNESLVEIIRSDGGGNVKLYKNEIHKTEFTLPYRWQITAEALDKFSLVIEPDLKLEHNVAKQVEQSGFVPQVLVNSDIKTNQLGGLGGGGFFSIQGGDEPKILSNYVFENDAGRKAHMMITTQNVQTEDRPIQFKVLQLHFNTSDKTYSIIYVNVTDWFRYEVPAFIQTVDNFQVTINGEMQPIGFSDTPIFRQVINDAKAKPEPEALPPARIGGCLIATASYGSELAPQVQLLREIRDNTVLQTQSGTSFMNGFNQFYYSFSPIIADYERESPIFKEATKLTLTPLLASLALLQYVDINSEHEMLGYGTAVILLNIGMYFVAPAVLIMKIRSFYKLQ